MAWGRTGDEYDDLDSYSRKAQRISSYANEDSDAITSASRRQDQRLLSNITNRLVNAQQPVQVMRTHRRPPIPPCTVRKVVPPSRGPVVVVLGGGRRAASVPPRAASVPPRSTSLDCEVEDYMTGASRPKFRRASVAMPRATYESKPSYRAASEPPLSPVADLAVRQAKRYLNRVESELGVSSMGGFYNDEPIQPRTIVRSGGNAYSRTTPVVYSDYYTRPAVGREVASRPVDFFAPTPMIFVNKESHRHIRLPPSAGRRRRASSLPPSLSRRDREAENYLSGVRRRALDDSYLYGWPRRSSYTYSPYDTYPAVYGVPRGVYESYAPYRYHPEFSRASLPPLPPAVGLRAHHPVLATRTTAGLVAPRRRYGSLPPPSPSAGRRSRIADIEDRLDTMIIPDTTPPKTSYSQLRQKASQVRDKMDRHKVLLDRFLPIYFGPENEVEYEVDYKFGELADRMPQLDPYRPPMPYHAPVDTSSYKSNSRKTGATYSKPQSGYSGRPAMSDTRRRIREVICATRKDPGYYQD